MGVTGQPYQSSLVVADRPFMALMDSTTSWDEDTYDDVYVGSCLENCGMSTFKNYSPTWQMKI